MADPAWALQKALFARLAETLDCPVYDAVPQSSAYPYVTFDLETVDDADYLHSRLDRRFLYLNVWSTYPGQREVKTIMAAIDAALCERPLPLEVGYAVSVRVIRMETAREPDNETFMGRVTLRVYTQH